VAWAQARPFFRLSFPGQGRTCIFMHFQAEFEAILCDLYLLRLQQLLMLAGLHFCDRCDTNPWSYEE